MQKEAVPDYSKEIERLLREKAELETEMEPNLARFNKLNAILQTK